MKKCFLIFLFFILCATYASAGTTSLTSFYPPPKANYNKVKLATNYLASISTGLNCTNTTTIFLDSTSGVLNLCTGSGTATPYCAVMSGGIYINNGALIEDASGTLHVCMQGKDTIFPQECYNSFCSFDNSGPAYPTASNACVTSGFSGNPCKEGFRYVAIDPGGDLYDSFQTSQNTTVISYVCCSGTAGTVYNPDLHGTTVPGTSTPGG